MIVNVIKIDKIVKEYILVLVLVLYIIKMGLIDMVSPRYHYFRDRLTISCFRKINKFQWVEV